MHRGCFPRPPRPLNDPAPYARDAAAPAPEAADASAPRPAGLTRRAWLLGAAGAVAAVAVPLAVAYGGAARTGVRRDGDGAPDGVEAGDRGAGDPMRDDRTAVDAASPAAPAALAPEWAVALQYATVDELISAAGDLEMVSSRFRSDHRLVPCFVRLLDVVLGGRHPDGDVAGACAVRSLHRLGRADLVRAQRSALVLRPDLTATQRAVENVLGDRRQRRGGGGRGERREGGERREPSQPSERGGR